MCVFTYVQWQELQAQKSLSSFRDSHPAESSWNGLERGSRRYSQQVQTYCRKMFKSNENDQRGRPSFDATAWSSYRPYLTNPNISSCVRPSRTRLKEPCRTTSREPCRTRSREPCRTRSREPCRTRSREPCNCNWNSSCEDY